MPAPWSVQQNLQPGDTLYGDRTFAVASVPAGLAGATWIRTANGSKTVTTDPLVTFSLNVAATISVAVDTWVDRRPWPDSSWVDTGLQLTDTEGSSSRTFEVYQKELVPGRSGQSRPGRGHREQWQHVHHHRQLTFGGDTVGR